MKIIKFVLVGCAVLGGIQIAAAQGTAFVYHGRLTDGTNRATGVYDLTFSLFDASTNGNSLAAPLTNSAVGITNGLFTATLDFGANFPGAERWLELGVRSNGVESFTTILPRQLLTPVPYAITASNLSGTLPVSQLSGTLSSAQLGGFYPGRIAFNNPSNSFSGDGSGLANLNASTLQGLSAASLWKTTGNAGTSPTNGNFLGTTDNNPLELRVNNTRAFRLQPGSNSVSIIGGWTANAAGTGIVTAAAATISGGGTPSIQVKIDGVNTLFTNMPNIVFADLGTVGGGAGNLIGRDCQLQNDGLESKAATISGGLGNKIQAYELNGGVAIGSSIGGGILNEIRVTDGFGSYGNTIAGGYANQMMRYPSYASIGGGKGNIITYSSPYATIGGGSSNIIDTAFGGTIAGGFNNTMSYPAWGGTIGGGSYNSIAQFALETTFATVAGGCSNSIQGGLEYSTISGGFLNKIMNNVSSLLVPSCTIAGGDNNTIQQQARGASIGGGSFNVVSSLCGYSVIGGGYSNRLNGGYATIPGGFNNLAVNNAFAAGSDAQAVNPGAFVWADYTTNNYPFSSLTNNEFAVRATGGARIVTAVDVTGNPSAGVKLNPGDTSWSTISDRNAKKDFAPVNGENVLDKLEQVPVEQWHYKWEADSSTPHIGPMAQDFKHAFYPGRDDKSITTLEFDGVELAAIEGLNEKLKQEAQTKDARISDLEQRLERLEKLISASAK